MTSKLVGKGMKRIRFYLRLDIILWYLDEMLICLDKIFRSSSPQPTKMDTCITRSKSLQEKHHHHLAIQVVSDTNSFAASLGRQFLSVGCPLLEAGRGGAFFKASWLPMGIFGWMSKLQGFDRWFKRIVWSKKKSCHVESFARALNCLIDMSVSSKLVIVGENYHQISPRARKITGPTATNSQPKGRLVIDMPAMSRALSHRAFWRESIIEVGQLCKANCAILRRSSS